ncbi:MAG: CaiB/BaiF CoA transferase family protein [Pararhodobacter sp.]
MDRKALDGLKVLDFTRVLAGPYATALMADLGAEVLKIEAPDGDEYRRVGPFVDGESVLFQTVNRGKRSMVADLKNPADLALVRRLALEADVLVENFRPGVMDKLGLGAADLRHANPRLIYASVSGFGQTGPNAARPAYDIIVQAMSGLMAMTGEADGAPVMAGEALGDVAGGLFVAWGIMAALYERERSGMGQQVDVALFDALLSMMPTAAARVLLAGQRPQRSGNRHALSAPFGVYPAQEGHFAVAVLNDRLFQGFCLAIERPELADDPRLASDALRRRHEPLLAQAIARWAGGLHATEAVARLAKAGIPASVLADARDAWHSDQAQARALTSTVHHPRLGALHLPEQPVHFSRMPRGGRGPAPALNEHGAMTRAALEG